jgi:multiple sugar transport system ATP-binding protein
MRTELKRLHHISGATTIYVTHDQVEALTMSTNIAVMKLGVIQQMASPDRVYHFPSNLFVADFIGNPKVNLLDGVVKDNGCVQIGDFAIPMDTRSASGKTVVAVRPEDVIVMAKPEPGAVEFIAYSVLPAGADSTIVAHRGETEITVKVIGISKIRMDQKIWLKFDPETLNLYDKESENLVAA